MARITDDELVSICEAEITSAGGYSSGELADERATAMDYYLGEPHGDEVEGRSQIRTREVLDTVEWVMPSLMRIFADAGNLVQFDPVGPEDEAQAEQETDRINFEFWKRNRGMYNLYTMCKDALLSKTGVLKFYVDQPEPEREEYRGLNEFELAQLFNDPSVEREVIEQEQDEDGWHVVFRTTPFPRIKIEPCPPEEIGVSADARSPYIADCQFVFHRTRKSRGELIADGYDRDLVDSLPTNEDVETEERLSRRHLSDEQGVLNYASHPALNVYWITECYLRIDRDDDGIDELVKVTLASGSATGSGATLLDVEEVDVIPFVSATPIILTHKFFGMSMADLTMDLQRIKSTLFRQILDNMYLANNQRSLVNDKKVNMDDFLTSRPGGAVRFSDAMSPGEVWAPIPSQPVPAQSFGLLEYIDEMRKQRTGVGDEVAALDKTGLANVNTGVYALAYDAARAKIELIARVISETALVPLFKGLHTLMNKHMQREEVIRLRGQWVPVNPSKWRSRDDLTVMVGMGQTSRERRLMGLEAIMEKQAMVWQNGGAGTLIFPHQLYKSVADYTESWGLEPDLYWTDPRTIPPRPPEGPSPEQQLMQAQTAALVAEAQTKQQRAQVDAFKVQAEMQMKQREYEIREREAAARSELETLKAQQTQLKTEMETAGKVASMRNEQEKRQVEQRMEMLKAELGHLKAERDREVEVYKVQMDAYSKQMKMHGVIPEDPREVERREQKNAEVEQERARLSQVSEAWEAERASLNAQLEEAARMNATIMRLLQEKEDRDRAPKEAIRDASGRIVEFGGRRIVRDGNGLIVRAE